jgi:hypothetical protein
VNPFRRVDRAHRTSSTLKEARRIVAALAASPTTYCIAGGRIHSDREIIAALEACILEIEDE